MSEPVGATPDGGDNHSGIDERAMRFQAAMMALLLVVALLTLAIHVRRRRRAALAAQWSEAQALRARALFDDAPGQS